MISLEDIQRSWRLIDQAIQDDNVPAQVLEAVLTPAGQSLLAVDGEQRHLLIPILDGQRLVEDRNSAGIHLLINQWGINGTRQFYIDIVCLRPHLNDVFDLIVYDICKELQKSNVQPAATCHQVLAEWRELVDRDSSGLPDLTTLIGVFGELWILRELSRRQPRSVQLWIGPNKARHDFSNGSTALEVKATQQRHSRLVTIHGHDQLDVPTETSLFLILFQLEEAPSGGEAIVDLVRDIIGLGTDQIELMRRLAQINITQTILEAVNNTRFRVISTTLFAVNETFPRIISSSFIGGALPNGVVRINYQIDLSVTPPYPLDSARLAAVLDDLTLSL